MPRSTEHRLLYILKSRGPQTASSAAEALSMTPAGAQQWLARLGKQGLAVAEDRRQARGRPRRYWQLTQTGHSRFPDQHSDLTLELLEATREVFGEEGLERLIAHREAAVLSKYSDVLPSCGNLGERVARLAELRSDEGYMARCETAGDNEFLLIEDHCPICAAAKACLGLCRSELEIFREVLGPSARVRRVEHVPSGARRCAYSITESSP